MSKLMRQHLLDKEKLAKEHMSFVNDHIKKLAEAYRDLQCGLTNARGKVEAEFCRLQTTLQQQKESVLQNLDTSVRNQQEALQRYTQHAEKVTMEVTKVYIIHLHVHVYMQSAHSYLCAPSNEHT